jgi:hypothetical protein
MILADNNYGCLLSIASLVYYAFFNMNPWLKDDYTAKMEAWGLLMKMVPFIGSIMIVLSGGKI